VDKKLISLIKQIRQKDIPCYLATNQEIHRTNYMRSTMRFDQIFDDAFSSAELRTKKPKPEFYSKTASKLAISEVSNVWLIEDTQANIDAAINFGFSGIMYQDFDRFNQFVRKQKWLA